ncbi:MAG TPA: family 78 glycoside hydrolase catalytic domain [Tepidisphaeraceae bacterium]|jgi:alpha-L-rhamnosidase|nr:family 78 glycoside hydrolase catalytic domain [Tepidisphaeraceae bacterium]
MSNASIAPVDLRCEYQTNPIGLGETQPRLSWKLSASDANARNLKQSAYQILVASSVDVLAGGKGDLWDSGKVSSDASTFVPFAGTALRSGQRAVWNVRVWDQDGNAAAPSETASWEMGLLAARDWVGQWVGSPVTAGGPLHEGPAFMVRKPFSLGDKRKITSARLYATALGFYEFHINGQRVGNDALTPGWTDYNFRVQYQAYDVTAMLRAGDNAIGAWLADGWYCGYIGNIDRRQYYGDQPKLLAQLHVTFDDGSTQTLATDGTWTTSTGPMVSADMLMGQHYDARLEQPDWSAPGFDAATWQPVTVFSDERRTIVATPGPTVRQTQLVKPVSVRGVQVNWNTHAQVIDFGQNLVGRVRLTLRNAPAGTVLKIRHAEVLEKLKDGNLYTTNLRSAKNIDSYTTRGDAIETFDPQFTFHGFRYAEVQGFPDKALSPDDVVAVVIHSDYESSGSFECSEPLVNQLQQNIRWGWRGNSVDIPTDCPQRNERLGWTGDAQAFVRTAAFNYDVAGFFAKWTQDLRDAQSQHGAYPSIVPDTSWPKTKPNDAFNGDGGPAWADAGIICPWTMWACYGDLRLVERHYASMVRFLDYLVSAADKFGGIRSHPEWKGWHGFGDWLSQDAGPHHIMGLTPKDLIGTAFIAYDARLLSQIASALGKEKDAARFDKIAQDTTAVFQRRFVTPDGLVVGGTQTSYVLALHFDLLPEASRATAVDWLVRDIKSRGNKLATGFVGTPYLNHVLSRFGRLDVAYDLLMQKNWPSWLYAVTQGATTIWERWDGWTHDKGFQDASMNSFNHYAYGAVGDWLYQVVAGIDIDLNKPGYRHIQLRPRPLVGGPLSYAKASLDTWHGTIESGWTLEGTKLSYRVVVPPNTTATVTVPGSNAASDDARGTSQGDGTVFEVGSGTYVFTSELAAR